MLKELIRLASWLRQAGFDEEAEETLNLDDDWLKEVGIDRDAEEKSLQQEESEKEPEESFEEKIPDALDEVDFRDKRAVDSDIPKLKEAGLIPASVDEKTLIGRGSFGRVYNVIWKGKPTVAKVGTESDAEAWSAILRIRESVPAEYHKHIPEIYEIIRKESYSIIVMKKLVPMNNRVSRDWRMGRRGRSVSQSIIEFERAYGRQALMEHLDYNIGHILPDGWETKLSLPTIEQIKSALKDEDPPPTLSELKKLNPGSPASHYQNNLVWKQIGYWRTGLKKAFESANSKFIKTKTESERERIGFALDSYVSQIYQNQYIPHDLSRSFPANPRDKDDRDLPPEFKSFYNFLLELEKHNIVWSDLGKSDNAMIDPDTREIVLTDVGNFHLPPSNY